MEKKVIVEIEYPEDVNNCWDHDNSGMQAFGDTVQFYAISNTVSKFREVIKNCGKRGITTEKEREKDPYYQYVMRQIDVVNSIRMCGYVDEEDKEHERICYI